MTGHDDLLARAEYWLASVPLSIDVTSANYELVFDLAAALRDTITRAEDAEADRREALIAINGGCGCPAPYTECPHDEPLLPALNEARRRLSDLETENAVLRADEFRRFWAALDDDVPAADTATQDQP